MDRFLTWLADKGLLQTNAMIKSKTNEERGLISLRYVRENEIVLQISDALIITAERVLYLDKNLDSAVQRYGALLSSFDVLCLFLLVEKSKGACSDFYPYLSVLPQSYSLPICQNLSKTSNLLPPDIQSNYAKHFVEYEFCVSKVGAVLDWLITNGCIENDHFLDDQSVDSRDSLLKWAWATVNTRCIYVDTDDLCVSKADVANDRLALVPYLDMINHSSEPKVACRYNRKSKCFDLTLINGTILEDEEIFISYGPHSNSKLFLEYGFVLGNNPLSFLIIPIEALKAYCSKCDFASIIDNHWDALEQAEIPCLLYLTECEPSWGFLAACKILSMSAEKLRNWRNDLYKCQLEELLADPNLIRLATHVLKMHAQFLEEESIRISAELLLLNISPYSKHCIEQLWHEEIEIIAQTLDQLSDL